jgi:hypothetical protein
VLHAQQDFAQFKPYEVLGIEPGATEQEIKVVRIFVLRDRCRCVHCVYAIVPCDAPMMRRRTVAWP